MYVLRQCLQSTQRRRFINTERHKKSMKRIILLSTIILMFLTTSCSLLEITKPKTIRDATVGNICWLDVIIFQTLNNQEALAKPYNDQTFNIKIITNEEIYYDGKNISGYYIMTDTYSYIARDSTIRTVPVYMRNDEYKKNNLTKTERKL